MLKPNIRTSAIYPLKGMRLPEKIIKEIETVKSKYPEEVKHYGEINLEEDLNLLPYDDIRKSLKKTCAWFKRVKKEMKRKAVRELGITKQNCEIEGFISFSHRPLFYHYHPKIGVIKIVMSICLEEKFYKMNDILEGIVESKKESKIINEFFAGGGYHDEVKIDRGNDVTVRTNYVINPKD